MNPWSGPEEKSKLEFVWVRDVKVAPGSRVRLWPRRRADIFDIALEGKTATVLSLEQDYENRIYLAVTVDDDPGKEFGEQYKPAHRFFFLSDEVEPLESEQEDRG